MKIIVSGGGTGGHIYPALALIKEIKKKDPQAEFLYVGTKNGLESTIVRGESIPFKTIEIQGFKRSLSLKNIQTIYLFLKSIHEAKKIIREFAPDVVLGTGGYVCSSVVYAAYKLKVPTMIHEQNSIPGITNKFLARYVDKIGICFPEAATHFPTEKVVMTGNPRAQEVSGIKKSDILQKFDLSPEKPTVLIFGGSRGAARINQAFIEATQELISKDYQILYASGAVYYDRVNNVLEEVLHKATNVKVVPYISNMTEVLANVDLIIGRAGATSLAEVTAIGVPCILVPSPNVTNDHQTKNAESLVKVGAAKIVKDQDLTGHVLVETLDNLMNDPATLKEMSEASRKEGITDASDRLYTELTNIMN